MTNMFLGDEFNEQIFVPWVKTGRYVDTKINMKDVDCPSDTEHKLMIEVISRKDNSKAQQAHVRSAITDLRNFIKAHEKENSIIAIITFSDVFKTLDQKALAVMSIKVQFKPTPPGKVSKANGPKPDSGIGIDEIEEIIKFSKAA